MPARLRAHVTYANAMATIAVFAALGGGAYAATNAFVDPGGVVRVCVGRHGALTALHTGKRCPKSATTLSLNQQGRPGANGATGASGAPGAQGATGPTGPAGPQLETAPSGRTMRGTYDAYGYFTESGKLAEPAAHDAVTFQLPLASVPATHVITVSDSPTPECPGTAAEPAARRGNLCVYEGGQVANGEDSVFNPDSQGKSGASKLGFVLVTLPGFSTGAYGYGSWGTWAVTPG